MTAPRIAQRLSFVAALLLCAACSSTSVRFEPLGAQPLNLAALDATVRCQVLGVEDDERGQPELRLRMLIEAPTAGSIEVDEATLALVSADLRDFGVGRTIPGTRTVTGTGRLLVDLGFPYDEGSDADLSRLELDWALLSEGRSYRGPVARFRGVVEKSGWRPRPSIGIGIGSGGVGVHGGIGF